MERALVLRGRLHGRRIELDEAAPQLEGDVEVIVRPVQAAHPTVGDLLAVVRTFAAGDQTKEELDHRLADERASWDRG